MVLKYAGGIKILIGILMVLCSSPGPVEGQLSGTFASCDREGEQVDIPGVSDSPCISCMCMNGIVKCTQTTCKSTEGCYVVLFDNFQADRKCCDVCKGRICLNNSQSGGEEQGCTQFAVLIQCHDSTGCDEMGCYFEGRNLNSSTSWENPDDPCETFTCRASVITKARTQCYTPCSNAVYKPGQCCPSCEGCFFDGRAFENGDKFNLSTSPCVQCVCQAGSVSCEKRACPVLNCPKESIYSLPGDCCPRCKGQRKIFNLPGGRCFYQKRIYSSGRHFKPDKCTRCTCQNGTSVCDREVCPHLSCPENEQVPVKKSCCMACPVKKRCEYQGIIYSDGQQWKPDTCTTCDCENGITHCQVQQCNNALWCPTGYKLQFLDDECCPKCVESRAVCTVYGDPHYRTFDERMFNFQGTCKYILTEDCFDKTFSIRVRNDARTSSKFTWTKMLVIFIGKIRISLHRKLRVKVNKKSVTLPFSHNELPYFTVVQDGDTVVLKWSPDLHVTWDGDSFVEVSVSSKYKRKLCGLCGNFNGLGFDDLIGRDGRHYFTGEEFGQTWRYGSRGACVIKPELASVESRCAHSEEAKLRARKECSFLLESVFHRCRRAVDVRPYYKSCVTDVCECPDGKRCECESFRAYARTCAQENINISWEDKAPCSAEKRCPLGARFRKCSNPCPKTCENYNIIEPCLKPCVPGCHCKSGLIIHEKKCIKPRDCPVRRRNR